MPSHKARCKEGNKFASLARCMHRVGWHMNCTGRHQSRKLLHSGSPDTREVCVAQYQHQPGHLTGLLRVAVEPSLDAGIRQVAAISFKNLVKADWEPHGARQRPSTSPVKQHSGRTWIPLGVLPRLALAPAIAGWQTHCMCHRAICQAVGCPQQRAPPSPPRSYPCRPTLAVMLAAQRARRCCRTRTRRK